MQQVATITFEQMDDSNEIHNSPSNEHRKRLDNIKQIENPHHFVHDGITVRVSFEGTADLNELVKGLFLADSMPCRCVY